MRNERRLQFRGHFSFLISSFLFSIFCAADSLTQQPQPAPLQNAPARRQGLQDAPQPLVQHREPPVLKEAEFKSAGGAYLVHIVPDPQWPKRLGGCIAELLKVNGGGRERVWVRYLVNDRGPARVLVPDSGQFVVTLDEFDALGTLPVVVYGPDGRVLRVHSIATLGLDDDRQRMPRNGSSLCWDKGAIVFFGPGEEQLVIRLRWGKTLFLNLRSGDVMDDAWVARHVPWTIQKRDWDALREFADAQIRTRALELFRSQDADERETAIAVARQLELKEAIPLLRELLKDQTSFVERRSGGPWTTVYYIRDAAKAALEELGEKVETSTTQPMR